MKVVSPYRPFLPESAAHRKLGAFDWTGALAMLRESVWQSCACETFAITDTDTALPGPTHHYRTTERRLMLWLLEVSLRYLESDAFDQDTVLVSPDMLVFHGLSPWLTADLGVLVRPSAKYRHRPILNGVQFWRHSAQDRLVPFYREVLTLAMTLPEKCLRWGADTEPLVRLLWPISVGTVSRADLSVRCIDAKDVMHSLDVDQRYQERPWVPVMDFKGPVRKPLMRAYYDATIGVPA